MKPISRFSVKVGGEGVIFLRPGRFVIGRRSDSDLILDRHDISRCHAVIVQDLARAVIEDQGSRNGIRVNGKKVTRCRLDHATVVHLGSVVCVFELLDWKSAGEDDPTPLHDLSRPPGEGPLTAAEHRVLALLLDGLSEKVIATKLRRSRHTIHNHVKKIYTTFGVNTRAELLAFHLVLSKLS